jgi:hypothetical protein
MMTVVGYPEEDEFNKVPQYCSKCGRDLVELGGVPLYDVYTGKAIASLFMSCPTRIAHHDHWKREAHGAWVNYG